MTESVDNKIVSIEFDNATFENRISATIKSLDSLKKSLDFAASAKGLNQLNTSAKNFDLSNMSSAIGNISHRLSLLGIVGATTIVGLTSAVGHFISSFAKKDIFGPIITGGLARAKNIEQAKFMFAGLGINIEAGMKSALDAVKGTAFGLDEAAKAAAQFGAAGITVGANMTSALRGVAGAAALTGTSFSEMAQIFEGSAGSGVVNNQDLGQFATRGLNAAAAVGKVMGKTEAQIHQMAAAGKLDFKTFASAMDEAFGKHATEANRTFSGALANMHAAMSRLGASFFTPQLTEWRNVLNALSPVIDAVNKALTPLTLTFNHFAHLGAEALIKRLNGLKFGNFGKAIDNFVSGLQTGFEKLRQVIRPIHDAFRDIFPESTTSHLLAFSKSFKDFVQNFKIGGLTATKLESAFRGLFAIVHIGFTVFKELLRVVGEVFHAISPVGSGLLDFGANTGAMLTQLDFALTKGGGIRDFFDKIVGGIRNAGDVIKGFAGTAVNFFDSLSAVIKHPIGFIHALGQSISTFFSNLHGPKLTFASQGLKDFFGTFKKLDPHFTNSTEGGFKRLGDRISWIGSVFSRVGHVVEWFWGKFVTLEHFISHMVHSAIGFLSNLGPSISKALKSDQLDGFLKILNAISLFLGGSGLNRLSKKGLGLNLNLGGSGLQKIAESFKTVSGTFAAFKQNLDTLRSTMKSMQTEIRSKAILNIAIALGVLTASVLVLSLIDPKALATSMGAMAAGFAELVTAMAAMDKFSSGVGSAAKMSIMSAGLIALAGAVVILAIAMKIFATMSWKDITKGLVGVGGGLAVIAGAMQLMPPGPDMILQSAGLIAVGAALSLIAGSMKIFATMSWGQMVKGLVGVGGGLLLIALAMNAMPNGLQMIGIGAGLIAVGVSLSLIAASMKLFATMSWGDMAKGLVGVGGSLLLIALAMQAMPVDIPITAAGILILSVAMNIMAKAVKSMGAIKFGTLVKSIGAFAVLLGILVVAMNLMTTGIAGAAALLIVSASMVIFAHVIKELGQLSMAEIGKGLLAIAGALAIVGLAALVLEPVIPAMLGMAVALALLGGSFALFGVGAILVAKSFEIMAKSGAAGAKAIVAAVKIILTAIPDLAKTLALAFVDFAQGILDAIPDLVKTIQKILDALLNLIIKEVPKIVKALGVIITGFLDIVQKKFPDIAETGFQVLLSFLKGISDHIEEITKTVAEIVAKFFNELAKKAPGIVDAIYNFIIAVLKEVSFKMGEGSAALLIIPGKFFIEGFLHGIEENSGGLFDWAKNLGKKILSWIGDTSKTLWHKGLDTIVGFLGGILATIVKVQIFFLTLPFKILGWIGDLTGKLAQKGIDLIGGFFNGIRFRIIAVYTWFAGLGDKIVHFIESVGRLPGKLFNIGVNLIQGLWNGIWSMKNWFLDKLKNVLLAWIPGWAKTLLHINSPSRVMMAIGVNVAEGLAVGIDQGSVHIKNAVKSMSDSVTEGFDPDVNGIGSVLKTVAKSLSELEEFKPVITPVLDLTQVQAQAKSFRTLDVSAGVSFKDAHLISATTSVGSTSTDTPESAVPSQIVFNQVNNSPAALTTNDIYRGTRSQVALAKKELNIP